MDNIIRDHLTSTKRTIQRLKALRRAEEPLRRVLGGADRYLRPAAERARALEGALRDLHHALLAGAGALMDAPEFRHYRDVESWVAMLSGPTDLDQHVISRHPTFSTALAAALEATIDPPADLPLGFEAIGVAPVRGEGRDDRGLPTCLGLIVVGWRAPIRVLRSLPPGSPGSAGYPSGLVVEVLGEGLYRSAGTCWEVANG